MQKSILLIEDQEHVRQSVIFTLNATDSAQSGMARIIAGGKPEEVPRLTMHEAASGEAGLALFQQLKAEDKTPDLAIVDMRMGEGIDGMETIRRMREIDRKIPIIIYSAWVDFTLQDIKDLNGDSFIEIVSKPRIRDLRQQVDRILF